MCLVCVPHYRSVQIKSTEERRNGFPRNYPSLLYYSVNKRFKQALNIYSLKMCLFVHHEACSKIETASRLTERVSINQFSIVSLAPSNPSLPRDRAIWFSSKGKTPPTAHRPPPSTSHQPPPRHISLGLKKRRRCCHHLPRLISVALLCLGMASQCDKPNESLVLAG